MAWNEEQYSRAKALVDSTEDPGQKSALQQGILKYEQKRSGELAAGSDASPEEKASLKVKAAQQRGLNPQIGVGAIQPTGLEALEKNETFQKANVSDNDLEFSGQQRWSDEEPLSFLKQPSDTALAGMPEQPKEVGVHLARKPGGSLETTSSLVERERSKGPKMSPLPKLETEGGLPSQTGDKSLYRPPEFVPPNASFGAIVKGSRVEFEPSVDQFRAAMGQQLGPEVMDLDESSPQYKAFADQQWAQKYDIAARAGTPITRKQFMDTDSWTGKVASAAYAARDTAEAALVGAGAGMTFGFGPEAIAAGAGKTDDLREQQARHPIASLAGGLLGAFNPASGVAKLGGMLNRTVGVAKTAKAAALAGAGVGIAEGIGTGAGHALGNVATGQDAVDSGTVMPAVAGGILGAGFGAGGHKLSELAGSAVKSLRKNVLPLPVAEAAFAETSAGSGLKPSLSMESDIAMASRLAEEGIGGTAKTAVQVAAERNAPAVAREAGSVDAALKLKYDSAKLSYQLSDEGKRTLPLKHGTAKLGQIIQRKTDALGDALPGADAKPFQKMLDSAFTPMLMDPDAARVAAATDGGWVMQIEKAKKLGLLDRAVELTPAGRKMPFDPDATARFGAARPGAPPPPGMEEKLRGKVLVMVPKKVDAAGMEQIIRGIDDAAERAAGAKISGTKPEDYGELMDAFRRDMQGFRANHVKGTEPVQLPNGETVEGYAALRYREGQEIGKKQALFHKAGLPKRVGPRGAASMTPEENEALQNQLAKFGRRSPAKDKALLELSKDNPHPLREIAGLRAYQELTGGPGSVPYLSEGSIGRKVLENLIPGRSLRLDPAMRAMALSVDEGAGREASEPIRQKLRLPGQYSKRHGGAPSRFEKMVADLNVRGFQNAYRSGDDAKAMSISAMQRQLTGYHPAGLSFGLRGGGLGGRAASLGAEEEKRRKRR